MKSTIIILFILSIAIEINNKLYWYENNKLSWNDFQAKPIKNAPNAALTNCNITFNLKQVNDSVRIEITNFFDKSKSWVKKNAKTDYLLNHEQKHFDLFEVYARILRMKMLEEKYTFSNIQKKLTKIYNETMSESNTMQNKYDKESKHSLDSINQKKWDIYIENELIKYSNFNQSVFYLQVNR